MRPRIRGLLLAALATSIGATGAVGQAASDTIPANPASPTRLYTLPPLNVTATRTVRDIFDTAAPVSVIDALSIRIRQPNTAADLLRDLPGLDVNGVGTNQTRPVIRGQRGQRILLLEDGMRMNNSRRQQDFGELPAIIDVNDLERVEVVRGPASVLYGSDAVGGVINMITREIPTDVDHTVGGRVQYTYRDAGNQHRPNASVFARAGRFGMRLNSTFRDTDPYLAPAGTFGKIHLDRDVLVRDTGVRDGNVSALFEYRFPSRHRLFARVESYWANDTGFGFVSNDDLGVTGAPGIEIRYPDQNVNKLTFGYRGHGLGLAIADRLDVTAYRMDNQRQFTLDIFIPLEGPAGAGVVAANDNFTDVETLGLRVEAGKLLGDDVVLTYGVDVFRDHTVNTDHGLSGVVGFGPPQLENTDVPTVPNATYQSLGAFAQADMSIADRVSLIAGARFQDVRASTRATPGLEDLPASRTDDQTVVGAVNLLVEVFPYMNVVASVGRAFRAPNLVELFFNGPTPEGAGFQVRNPDLQAEKSLNVDLGLKYRREDVAFEAYYFRNEVTDGIRIAPTGEDVGPFPGFRNVNVDKLRFEGVEINGEVMPLAGVTVGGTYTYLDSKDVLNPNNPLGDTYSSKITAKLGYRDPAGRFWGEYRVRHNGEQRDTQPGFLSLLGDTLPAFTVHDARVGLRIFRFGHSEHSLQVSVENLTNRLYAEFSNASFFRPEPRRSVMIGWGVRF